MSGLGRLAAPHAGFSSKVSLIHAAPARYRQMTVGCINRLHSATSAANQRRTAQLTANQLTSSSPSANQLLPLSCSANWRWQQWREYRDFGHGPPQKQSRGYRVFQAFVCLMVFASLFNWKLAREIWNRDRSVQAAAVTSADSAEAEGESNGEEEEEDDEDDDKKTQKVGFRDRKIIEYENRIRQYSTPDKIFRYFATLRVIHDLPDGNTSSEVYMTPLDFLRSITPGVKQPEGLGLDQYKRFDPKNTGEELHLDLDPDSIFYKLGSHGLISFSDYIFLLTIMSTSSRQFEIAFQMFDFNGDGDVDSEEFEKVSVLIRQQTSVGSRHRDHTTTGSTFRGINSALSTYFFGQKLDKKLTIEKFLDFQSQLQREILCLEFKRKMPNEDGLLKEADFADLLLAYGGYPPNRKLKMMRRVKKKFKESPVGVSVNDYLNFYQLLNSIHDVDTALTFYHIAGASIDPATLKHVAKTVARVDLSDHVVDIVFTLFDDNNDGQLSNREFVAVMKARANRGLEKPKDTNFVRLLRAVSKCIGETKPQVLSF